MARKEHKGGELTNEDLNKDQATKHPQSTGGYHGSQDTADKGMRQHGTEVQKTDGLGKNRPGKPQ